LGEPVPVPGPFTNVAGLIDAGGTLAFVALPNFLSDRQVFTYNGTAFTQLTNVSPTDATDFSPSELTYFNNRIYFAARDHADGSYESPQIPFVGRELWSVPLGGGPTTVAANIGGPDEAPHTIFFEFPPFGSIPIGTDPGNVVSSTPVNLEASGNELFFSAFGSNGRELYIVNSGGALADFNLAAGTASSNPFGFTSVQTQAGLRTYFVANGELWIDNGTAPGVQKIVLGGATGVGQLTAVGDKLYFRAGNQLWVTGPNPLVATPFEEIIRRRSRCRCGSWPAKATTRSPPTT
jgi:hypothetical protein